MATPKIGTRVITPSGIIGTVKAIVVTHLGTLVRMSADPQGYPHTAFLRDVRPVSK